MGRKKGRPPVPAGQRESFRNRKALLHEGSLPYRTGLREAFDLGRSGHPMPAWIQCDVGVKVEPVYGEADRTIGALIHRKIGEDWKETPGAYQRAYLQGKAQRDKYTRAANEVKHQKQMRRLLRDLGWPETQDNLRILREESRKAAKQVQGQA